MTARTDPRIIRAVLAYADEHGVLQTARKFGVVTSNVYRWLSYRERFGPAWPTDADVERWLELAPARARNAARKRLYQKRIHLMGGPIMVDSTGTGRRLRALGCLGWTQAQVGTMLRGPRSPRGMSGARVSMLAAAESPRVFRATAATVRRVYDELSMTRPTGVGATQARAYAALRGWLPPLAWDDDTIDDPTAEPYRSEIADSVDEIDEVAIMRRMHGDRTVPVTRAERAEVVRRLKEQECSDVWISQQTGIARVDRYRVGA